jgi:hypothetical protein
MHENFREYLDQFPRRAAGPPLVNGKPRGCRFGLRSAAEPTATGWTAEQWS